MTLLREEVDKKVVEEEERVKLRLPFFFLFFLAPNDHILF